jgi:hypothetical protein
MLKVIECRVGDWINLAQNKDKLLVLVNNAVNGHNRPTLCTDYYSFIYYLGSYMFRGTRWRSG